MRYYLSTEIVMAFRQAKPVAHFRRDD